MARRAALDIATYNRKRDFSKTKEPKGRKLKGTGDDDEALVARCPVSPARLAELVRLIDAGTISGKIAKDVFERMWATGQAPGDIVKAEEAVLAESPGQVETYRKGKTSTLGWFVGQVMRKTGGKANPQLVNDLLKKALAG